MKRAVNPSLLVAERFIGRRIPQALPPFSQQTYQYVGYGWIKRGQNHEIPSNTGGQQRININDAIDCAMLRPRPMRYDDTINAQATVALLQADRAITPQRQSYLHYLR